MEINNVQSTNFGKKIPTRMLIANVMPDTALMGQTEPYFRKLVNGKNIPNAHCYYFRALLNQQYPDIAKIAAEAYKKASAGEYTIGKDAMSKLVKDVIKDNNLPKTLDVKMTKGMKAADELLRTYG